MVLDGEPASIVRVVVMNAQDVTIVRLGILRLGNLFLLTKYWMNLS